MDQEKTLVAFEKHTIRRFIDEAGETWYFSVVDVVAALTDSANPQDYWFKMKIREKTEDGFELSTIFDGWEGDYEHGSRACRF